MKRTWKRVISLLLVVCMMMTFAATAVFDDEAFAETPAGEEVADLFAADTQRSETPLYTEAAADLSAADGTADLKNVIRQCTFEANSDRGPENCYDGDYTSFWGQNSGFPGTFVIKPPAAANQVKTVKVYFQANQGVTVAFSVDGKAVDTQVVNAIADAPSCYTYTFDTATEVSELKFYLTDPTNSSGPAGFWPCIAEAEVWADTSGTPLELNWVNHDRAIEYPRTQTTAWSDSEQSGYGPALMLDGNNSTKWEAAWNGAPERTTITLELPQAEYVTGFMYTSRQDNNIGGAMTEYSVLSSTDGNHAPVFAQPCGMVCAYKGGAHYGKGTERPVQRRLIPLRPSHAERVRNVQAEHSAVQVRGDVSARTGRAGKGAVGSPHPHPVGTELPHRRGELHHGLPLGCPTHGGMLER